MCKKKGKQPRRLSEFKESRNRQLKKLRDLKENRNKRLNKNVLRENKRWLLKQHV